MGESYIEDSVFDDLIDGYKENGGIHDHDTIWECLETLGRKPAVYCLYEDLETRALDYPEKLIEQCYLSEIFPRKVELMDALYLNRYMTRICESRAGTKSPVKQLDARAEGIMGFFYRFWNNRNSGAATEFYMISYDAFIDLLREYYGDREETDQLLCDTPKIKEFCDAKLNMRKVFQRIDAGVPRIWHPRVPLGEFANRTRAAIRDMENCILRPLFYAFHLIELDGDIRGHEISEKEIIIPNVAPEDADSWWDEEEHEEERENNKDCDKRKGADKKWRYLRND